MKKINNKGITLVALIITIVVLLILAVVAIGAVKDSNIIAHAQKAGNDYTIAEEKEQIGLAVNEWQLQKVIPGNTKTFKEVITDALQGQIEPIVENTDGSLTVTFTKTGNVYIVDKNGNTTKQEDDNNDDDDVEVTGDFEITVIQTPNGEPVQSVTLTIRPTIPDSWKHVYTEEERNLAATDVARYHGVTNSDGTEIITLEQLLIANGNTMPGLPKQYGKDEYEEMIQVISTVTTEDISTPEKAFTFMMGQMGLSYITIQEWATDIGYVPTTKILRIQKNGGEWKDVTEKVSWDYVDAEYELETLNGIYNIEMILDDKKATKQIEIREYLGLYAKYDANGNGSVEDETILWRVLRDDNDKVELITADSLGELNLEGKDFSEGRINYNDAVRLIVEECKKITGITENIRSVGGPEVDETTNDKTVKFSDLVEKLGFSPTVSIETFAQYEGLSSINGLKVADNKYEEDYNQMQKSGTLILDDDSLSYWVASREVKLGTGNVEFIIRSFLANGGGIFNYTACIVQKDGSSVVPNDSDDGSRALRPILTLSPGSLDNTTQSGTEDDPIEIYQNK